MAVVAEATDLVAAQTGATTPSLLAFGGESDRGRRENHRKDCLRDLDAMRALEEQQE